MFTSHGQSASFRDRWFASMSSEFRTTPCCFTTARRLGFGLTLQQRIKHQMSVNCALFLFDTVWSKKHNKTTEKNILYMMPWGYDLNANAMK